MKGIKYFISFLVQISPKQNMQSYRIIELSDCNFFFKEGNAFLILNFSKVRHKFVTIVSLSVFSNNSIRLSIILLFNIFLLSP